jgi:hypothetical protein
VATAEVLAKEGTPATADIQYQEHHGQATSAETLATGGYWPTEKQAKQTYRHITDKQQQQGS